MKKNIPNFITLLNLFCGLVATVMAVQGALELAAIFVFLGIIFDFFDGFAARILKVQSELGVQLDSLADMVTSGVVPGLVMYKLFQISLGGETFSWSGTEAGTMVASSSFLPYFGFVITLASAWRLANFNIDENQVDSFIGLPTPANALFVLSLPLIVSYQGSDLLNELILNRWTLFVITLVSAWMLNAKIPLFALKFKDWRLQGNAIRYTFLVLSLIFVIAMKFLAIPFIIVLYVVLSLVWQQLEKSRSKV